MTKTKHFVYKEHLFTPFSNDNNLYYEGEACDFSIKRGKNEIMDFLAEQHQCGQHLLKLVARGNSIIAELLRLKDVIPSVYR
jgi:hypothetical protein